MSFLPTASLLARCLGLLLMLGVYGSSSTLAQSPTPGRDAFDGIRIELDQIEATLSRPLQSRDLVELRRRIEPLREQANTLLGEVEPRLADAKERLTQLGPKPADDAPPETGEIKEQREALTKSVAEFDAHVRQIKVTQIRVEQISDRITEQRRALVTAQLLVRSNSVFDPRFWYDLNNAIPRVSRGIRNLIQDWGSHLSDIGFASLVAAGSIALLALGFMLVAYRFLRKHGLYRTPADIPASELAKVLAAFRTAAERSLIAPLVLAAAMAIIGSFDLRPARAIPLEIALISAVVLVSVTRGIMQAVLAPGAPAYRLVNFSDPTAEAVFHATRAMAWIAGVGLVLLALTDIIIAPVAVTVLLNALIALGLVIVALRFLRQTTQNTPSVTEDEPIDVVTQAFGWIRPTLWLVLAGVIAALVAGYVTLGSFIATRIGTAIVISALTVLFLRLLDALIAETFSVASTRARRLAASVGISPRPWELVGTLLAGLIRVGILLIAALIVFGPWRLGGVDSGLDDMVLGMRLGDLRNTAVAILGAGIILAAGFFLVRAVLRWIREQVLPLSGMDSGLQNSVSTILGYAGVALVIGLGLRQLGLDLSNLAIVAGALSVGIGFGLQSIVSNFVSGLILLAERPIRVGDSIVVRGEEGYVRKISVRSTEIETFERATVIVPNSDLISGVVKNWTHTNSQGRVIVPVRVAYDSDADFVRNELIAAALEQPHIIRTPPPRVFLIRFGDTGLEFELRCIVDDVDKGLSTKSDLHLAILRRFRDAGIIIAPPEQRVQTPPTPALPAPGAELKST